jgi:hypothetical protein
VDQQPSSDAISAGIASFFIGSGDTLSQDGISHRVGLIFLSPEVESSVGADAGAVAGASAGAVARAGPGAILAGVDARAEALAGAGSLMAAESSVSVSVVNPSSSSSEVLNKGYGT